MKIVQGTELRWESAGKPGLQMKTVRRDDGAGTFLGLIAFEPLTTTGVHQHLGMAFSYMLAGGLTDYAGTAGEGDVGINFFGSTHDAIAYRPTLMVSRLEGPVVHGPDITHALHAGAAVQEAIHNACPDMPPDCNLPLQGIKASPTWVPGVERRLVFDYLPTGQSRRLVDLTMLPGASVPHHLLSGVLDLFVIAGDLELSGMQSGSVSSGGFAMCEPGEEIALKTRYGAHLMAWIEGPAAWSDGRGGPDFYGFDASFASPRLVNR